MLYATELAAAAASPWDFGHQRAASRWPECRGSHPDSTRPPQDRRTSSPEHTHAECKTKPEAASLWLRLEKHRRVRTWKSSGAAYGGEPQKVSSFPPTVNSLLKPKSAILMFMSASRRRFSAWDEGEGVRRRRRRCEGAFRAGWNRWVYLTLRSRWTMRFWWQYCTADTIWKQARQTQQA